MGPNWIDLHIGFLLLSKQGHVHNCYLERYSDLEVSLSYTQHCLCPSPITAFAHHLALPLPITQHCLCPSPITAFAHHLTLYLPITQHCLCPLPSTARGIFSRWHKNPGRKFPGRWKLVPVSRSGVRFKTWFYVKKIPLCCCCNLPPISTVT